MRLYEMLERVSEVVYQDNPSPLLTYLKNTLNSVYTRSSQNGTPNCNATNLHCCQKR